MGSFKIYYRIVPVGDGYHFLSQNSETNEFYLFDKASDDYNNPEILTFSSEQKAAEWIKASGLPEGKYCPEWFGTSDIINKFSDIGEII